MKVLHRYDDIFSIIVYLDSQEIREIKYSLQMMNNETRAHNGSGRGALDIEINQSLLDSFNHIVSYHLDIPCDTAKEREEEGEHCFVPGCFKPRMRGLKYCEEHIMHKYSKYGNFSYRNICHVYNCDNIKKIYQDFCDDHDLFVIKGGGDNKT